MPSAYAETKKDKEKGVREDIGGLMAELSKRPTTPERIRKLTGPERAAVLMLSLGEQYGAKIFSLLDDDELREISIVMSSLGTIEANRLSSCCSNSSAGCRRQAPCLATTTPPNVC